MAGVVAAVQTAVSLMELSDEMVERQKQLRDDEKGRRAELLSFSALSKRMETALKMPNQGTEALRQVIGRIADAGRLEIDRAIDELNVQREGERVEYRQRLAKRCHALLQALVGNHTLPQGRRILSWSAQNGAGDAQIKTEFHRGLNTLVRVTLGQGSVEQTGARRRTR